MSLVVKRTCLLLTGFMLVVALRAQNSEVPKGWHMLDKTASGYYGISTDKAYQFVKTKKLKSKT